MSYTFLNKIETIVNSDFVKTEYLSKNIVCIIVDSQNIDIDTINKKHNILTKKEIENYKNKIHSLDKKNSFISSFLKRYILATVAVKCPKEIVFSYNKYGKPSYKGVHFNVSHTKSITAFCISKNIQCGIDVQVQSTAYPKKYFSTIEAQYVESHAESGTAIAQLWSIKESILKNIGTGIQADTFPIIPIKDVGDDIFNYQDPIVCKYADKEFAVFTKTLHHNIPLSLSYTFHKKSVPHIQIIHV